MLQRGTATGGMLLLAAAVMSMSGCDSRGTLTPDQVIEGLQHYPETPATNPRSVTEEKCGDQIPCKSAVMTDQLTVYKFTHKDDAVVFTRALGQNGYQSDWIVLEYKNAANDTDPTKATYAGRVDGIWSSD